MKKCCDKEMLQTETDVVFDFNSKKCLINMEAWYCQKCMTLIVEDICLKTDLMRMEKDGEI